MGDETTPAVRQMRLVVETDDLDEAVAFYRDVLGLAESLVVDSEGGARVVVLEAGRATLELINPAQRLLIDEIEVGRPVSRGIRVAFEVDDATGATRAPRKQRPRWWPRRPRHPGTR